MTYPDSPSPQLAGNASDELPLLNSACTVTAPAFVAPLRCAGNLLRQPASLVEGQLLIKQSESAISRPKASESPKMSGTAGKKNFIRSLQVVPALLESWWWLMDRLLAPLCSVQARDFFFPLLSPFSSLALKIQEENKIK